MEKDPNKSLKSTLKTFVRSKIDPEYAILITGAWGVGKTHLINELLDGGIEEVTPFYISLYGVNSKDDFDKAVLSAIYPYTDGKAVKLATGVTSAIAGMVRFKLDMQLSDIAETVKAGVFIFDDLERIGEGIKLRTLMGFLNKFIEHAGCRVILICNDDEIEDKDVFAKTKEKLVGRTLRVKPATTKALSHFLNEISNKQCKKFLKENRSLIEKVYETSQVNNLRILKQALWDMEQLFSCLDKNHKADKQALFELFRLFLMFAIEAKCGTLKAEELLGRKHGLWAAARRNDNEREKTTIENLNSKYAEIYAYDTILSSEILTAMIFDGDFNKDEITASLNKDRRFIAPEDEPEWKTVWYGTLRDEKQLETAVKTMEEKYRNRDYTNSYILLHVFTQRLWLASLGYLKESENEIVNSVKVYIDGLLKDGLLEPYDTHNDFSRHMESYDGLGYSGKEKEPFQNVVKYLVEKRREAFKQTLVDQSSNILTLMKEDVNLFVTKLLPYQGKESEYGHHPILAEIDPSEFSKTLFELSANEQHEVFMLFSNRYKRGLLDNELASEKPWLCALVEKLQSTLKSESIFLNDRFNRFMNWYIEPILEDK